MSCGRACERPMSCGHKCVRVCHSGPCDGTAEEPVVCTIECGLIRACGHRCRAKCHSSAAGGCPPVACKEIVTAICLCGTRIERSVCGYNGTTSADAAQQSMAKKLSFNTTLECNDECAVRDRNRRLADALGIQKPSVLQAHKIPFPRSMFEFVMSNKPFVVKLEQTLEDFIADERYTHETYCFFFFF